MLCWQAKPALEASKRALMSSPKAAPAPAKSADGEVIVPPRAEV